MSLFLVSQGAAMSFMWMIMNLAETLKEPWDEIGSFLSLLFLPGLFFPFLLPFSPLVFILIKIISIIKPNNHFLKAQSTLGGRGESILEAAPQFVLQCYIILSTLELPD